ncbi:hypothetical protein D3C73_1590630 [compost metagenome]
MEGSYNVNDSITVTDISQELITKTFTFTCPGYKSGNVNKSDGRGEKFSRSIQIGKFLQAAIWHRYDASVRLDCGKGVVGR